MKYLDWDQFVMYVCIVIVNKYNHVPSDSESILYHMSKMYNIGYGNLIRGFLGDQYICNEQLYQNNNKQKQTNQTKSQELSGNEGLN